jgi:hypothetical protein
MGLNLDKINFFKINQYKGSNKLVLFGAGLVCKKFIKNFDKSKILYIIDNNESLWTTRFEGIEVKSPKKLKGLKNTDVIITTTSFVDVIKQIESINQRLSIKVSDYLKDLINIEILQDLNKKLLISSGLPPMSEKNSGGGLYEIDLQGSKWNLKKVYSGTVHGVIKIDEQFAISDSTHGVILLDKNYRIKKKGKYPLNTRAHGIAYDKNKNLFYVACSNTDKVKIFNADLKFIDTISISDKFEVHNSPQHHINDLCVVDGNLYVSMFSLSGNHKRNIYDGGIYEINLKTKKIKNKLYGNLTMPHSIKYINENFTILDSLKGDLVISNNITATFSGFSRGLSFDGTYYYIGQSRNRNFSLINAKKNNVSIDNSILIYDRNNKISRSLFLPFGVSEIHEVLDI